MRLDKYLSEMGIASRREIKEYGKKGRIKVNDNPVKSTDYKIDADIDKIEFDGKIVRYEQFEYYMLNKPAGTVSATVDNNDKTVIDLIESNRKKDLFPVGRLDKDTVGLLIITNDGELSHNLLSPVKHVDKTYFARVEGRINETHINKFKEGIILKDGTVTKPAELKIVKSGEISEVEITIHERKYHQIKRMVASTGRKVIYLKRLSMGGLKLDESLKEGEYRRLDDIEVKKLCD